MSCSWVVAAGLSGGVWSSLCRTKRYEDCHSSDGPPPRSLVEYNDKILTRPDLRRCIDFVILVVLLVVVLVVVAVVAAIAAVVVVVVY